MRVKIRGKIIALCLPVSAGEWPKLAAILRPTGEAGTDGIALEAICSTGVQGRWSTLLCGGASHDAAAAGTSGTGHGRSLLLEGLSAKAAETIEREREYSYKKPPPAKNMFVDSSCYEQQIGIRT